MLPATQAITRAFATDMSTETAAEVGIYMADWGEEVATMAAIHLFPERFTAKEIQVAIEYVLVKIPYDVAWAAHLLGEPIEACFLSQLKAQPATRRKRSPKRKPTKRLG